MTDFTADHSLNASGYQVDATRVAEAIMCKLALVRRGREAIRAAQPDRSPDAESPDR